MKKLFLTIGMVVVGLAGSRGTVQAQNILYGVTAFENQLITVNSATGAGTLVGGLGVEAFAYGIANRNSSLYIFDQGVSQIRLVDPTTGAAGAGINIGVGTLAGEGDLAFRADGIGFLASIFDAAQNPANNLYSFNIANGTSTLIGSTGLALDGLAFNGNTLYALGQDAGALYTVNQTTASLTPVGVLGLDPPKNSPFAAIAFDPNGTLYGAIDDRLYTINTTTGAATPVDPNTLDFGFSSVSGLAFVPVPEPGTIALFGLGSLVFLARLRGKK